MKDVVKTLEFDLVKEEIKTYSLTEIGHSLIDSLTMFENMDSLKAELAHLEEMMKYIVKYQNIKIYPLKNITTQFDLLAKGASMNEEFFYEVLRYLENAKEIKESFIKDENFEYLLEEISYLNSCEVLKNRISKVINKDLEVMDSASTYLSDIRRNIKNELSSQGRIISLLITKYKDYLNNERVALRNSNFVLPVKTSYKNKVNGVVIDESDTGLTSFIEPSEIIASNNKIDRLKEKEKEEIARILEELSKDTLANLEAIENDVKIISYLDFLSAKANYGIETESIVPSISEKKIIKLINARHPLIDKKKVVKNSYILDKERIMVITGPNAGGKTVSLKVIGLLVLMSHMGLALPTSEKAEISFFKNIFVDMGDSQSLVDNLSTFSGHISNIIEICNEVNEDSLVILDELGTGTSPLEGEALGIGIIEYLQKKGAFLVLTSHFDGLKNFALEKDYILNASMAFDDNSLSPTYHLRLGVAGKSYGLTLAKKMGLKEEILESSNQYLSQKEKEDKEVTRHLLEEKLAENEQISVSLKEEEEVLKAKIKAAEQEKQNLIKEKEKLRLDAEDYKEKLIEETKESIEEIYEEFKNKNDYKLHEVITAKRKLDLLIKEDEENSSITYEPKVGDRVRMNDFNIVGTITRINGDYVNVMSREGISFKVKINALTKMNKEEIKPKKTYVSPYRLDHSVPLECNIVGYHIEEGIREIDKYLDDAIIASYKEVRIIHGHGTGKLRTAVHEYLSKRKDIKGYRLGGAGEGGVGATVVYLK